MNNVIVHSLRKWVYPTLAGVGGGFVITMLLLLAACNQPAPHQAETAKHCVKQASLPVKYAKGFTIDYYNGFKVVSVRDLKDTTKVIAQYVIMPKGKPAPVDFTNAIVIDTPAQRIVCISTNHAAGMVRLGLLDRIGGLTNVGLIYDSSINQAVADGKISNLGNSELNYEKLLGLNPSFVFSSGSFDGGDKMKMKLESLHIKTVLNLDYMEQDPLARAEWLKFTAAFFDKEYEADSIFKAIESNYLTLKEKAKAAAPQPTVFCNMPFKEIWYMPCGENYIAYLFADAGGNFLWKDVPATNGLNLSLDYEAVYNKAANADYWINTGLATSLDDIKKADKKNTLFKAYKQHNVYNCDLRRTKMGGIDFWESATINPDIVLADLIYILHPEILPEHQLYYYRKLN